ncbi:unnamed protein product [Porites lobata]|uniref:Uncharacterized protein n=1 Tax=Porites lobata TaxID=104759 RepID=A0ABN8QI49_9CNID|nr:unnamed protein product [Porites lobata]
MDTDAAFFTPVTKSSTFNGTKLRNWSWGCHFVVDSMTYFPVYIYWDTFTYCREHILERFKTRNFEEAFRTFYQGFLYPVSIILSYAWSFERDR